MSGSNAQACSSSAATGSSKSARAGGAEGLSSFLAFAIPSSSARLQGLRGGFDLVAIVGPPAAPRPA